MQAVMIFSFYHIAPLKKQSLLKGNDRFRGQEDINEVVLHSLIALIEFEIEYCLTEHKVPSDGLKKAKEDLHLFLAGKRG